jgi:hypothetical protein
MYLSPEPERAFREAGNRVPIDLAGLSMMENSPEVAPRKHLQWEKQDVSYLSRAVDDSENNPASEETISRPKMQPHKRKVLAPLSLTPNRIALPSLPVGKTGLSPGMLARQVPTHVSSCRLLGRGPFASC